MTIVARPLETGWLPDTPIDDSLLRRFVANQAGLQERLAAAVGGQTAHTTDVAMSDAGVPAAPLNQAALRRPITDPADPVLDRIQDFYRGSVGLLLSPWPTPDLGGRGWQLVGHPMFVVRAPTAAPASEPPGDVALRLATSAHDLALVERLVATGYPLPELDDVPANHALGPALLDGAVRFRIGYLDRAPVAAAASHVSHGVVNLCLAATLPAARRRGVWKALVDARCADAADLPCAAFTSDASRPGFVRMGFLPICRFTLWGIPG